MNRPGKGAPCLCGEYRFHGQVMARELIPGVEQIFSSGPANLVIFRLGDPGPLVEMKQHGEDLTLVFGRVYTPLSIEPDLKGLDGSFALIRFRPGPAGDGQLLLAVDRFGMRPAFYVHDPANGALYVATHLAGIRFLLADRLPPISRTALIHYYHFGFTPSRDTLLTGVHKVPAGSMLIASQQGIRLEHYFDLAALYRPGEYSRRSEEEIAAGINAELDRSIRLRLGDKTRLALALSGGVDSGFVARKAREMGVRVTGYHLAYENRYNEFSRVERLAKDFSLDIVPLVLSTDRLIENMECAAALTGEPIGFNDAALMVLHRAARADGFDALWDGDGVDRLFFGMNRYMQYYKLYTLYRRLGKVGLDRLLIGLTRWMPKADWQKASTWLQNWRNGLPPYPERRLEKDRAYNREFEEQIFDLAIKNYWQSFREKFPTGDMILYFTYQSVSMCPEIFFHAPADLQASLGLGPVSPYFSPGLVSLALSIPSRLKVKQGQTKYILRLAASGGRARKYWFLPKKGLQNSFGLIEQSASGKEWLDYHYRALKQGPLAAILLDHLQGQPLEPVRLLPAHLHLSGALLPH